MARGYSKGFSKVKVADVAAVEEKILEEAE